MQLTCLLISSVLAFKDWYNGYCESTVCTCSLLQRDNSIHLEINAVSFILAFNPDLFFLKRQLNDNIDIFTFKMYD